MNTTTQQLLPATGHQLFTIAKLCSALHIKEEYEQNPMTMAQAGELIRTLQNKINKKRKGIRSMISET